MKKILAFIISASVCGGTVTALAKEDTDFIVVDGMITEYTGSDSYVEIPACIDGEEIAGIDFYAFEGNENIETVVIEDGIEVIQSYAFSDCYDLKTVICPDSLLVIGLDAFYNCGELADLRVADTTDVLMAEPKSATVRDTKATYTDENGYTASGSTITGYSGGGTVLSVPSQVNGVTITSIGADAFSGNTAITSVTIPDTVTNIGNNAFKDCTALTSAVLSSNLASAGTYVFSGCKKLASITIPGTLKTVPGYMFNNCSGLKTVVLEPGVNKLDGYAFYYCTALETITIPSSLNYINTWAMGYCKKLKSFYIPNGVTYIGDAAFYYCNVINNINMPNTVTYMGTHCFRGCWALTNIVLSENLTSINYRAFHNCAFTSITIPANVKTIGIEPFWYCTKLKTINIPAKVTSIGNQAFYNCPELTKAVMYGNVKKIGTNIFGTLSDAANTTVTMYAPEGSFALDYAATNSIKNKPIVALNEAVADYSEIGTIGAINYPFTEKIQSFGAKYIPKTLYDEQSEDYLDIGYENAEAADGNTYLTLMTDVPENAMVWTYKVFPYLILSDGTEIKGTVKEFTVAETIMTMTGEDSSYEVE